MKKLKPPLFSPTQFATHMNERIGTTPIGAAIARNCSILRDHFFEPLFELEDYLKLLEDIRTASRDPALQGKLEESWDNEAYELNEEIDGLDEEITILSRRARYACLYLELARAAEENKDRDRAWAFNNETSLIIGGLIEESAVIQRKIEANRLANQNSENGKGRIRNFLPAKQEAARLLIEMKPEDGWPTLVDAVSAIAEPLGNFIDTNRIGGIKSSNIRSLLEKTWIPKDLLVNSAWLNSKRPKTKRQKTLT